jgi:hypothetical protein
VRLSALGGDSQRRRADHEDDGPGTDVSRQHSLPYREGPPNYQVLPQPGGSLQGP